MTRTGRAALLGAIAGLVAGAAAAQATATKTGATRTGALTTGSTRAASAVDPVVEARRRAAEAQFKRRERDAARTLRNICNAC